MSSAAITNASNYLKIAGASIYAFDYIQTLPAEYRLYRKQNGFFRFSMACWLLIAVRYLGMIAILLSLVGGFSTNFTEKSCNRFFIIVPLFKVFAAVASHAVFIFRTYAICGRNRLILWVLLVMGGILGAAEIISPVVVPRNSKLGVTGNCISDLSKGSTSWIQYLCQVVFDLVILGLTIDRLFRGTQLRLVSRSDFTKVFWESQVIYFVAVTAINILNLIFFVKYNKSSESTMFATLGMAITAIFSARVILDLHEAANHSTYSTSGPSNAIPNIGNGIHTTTYRNGEIVDRQFRADEVKTNTFRMENLEAGGIHIQREVVAITDDQASLNSWDRTQPDKKSVLPM